MWLYDGTIAIFSMFLYVWDHRVCLFRQFRESGFCQAMSVCVCLCDTRTYKSSALYPPLFFCGWRIFILVAFKSIKCLCQRVDGRGWPAGLCSIGRFEFEVKFRSLFFAHRHRLPSRLSHPNRSDPDTRPGSQFGDESSGFYLIYYLFIYLGTFLVFACAAAICRDTGRHRYVTGL